MLEVMELVMSGRVVHCGGGRHNVLNSFACMLQCKLCSFNVIYYSGKVL